jgi:two-component system sensor histidine kinase MtrB
MGGPLTWWRSSLAVRVISLTLLSSLLTLTMLGALLLSRVTDGLLQSRQQSALSESTAGLADAQRIVTSSAASGTSPTVLVDSIVSALAARAGQPPLYDVLLLATPQAIATAPERGTNLVLESSIPAELRTVVEKTSRQAWTYTTIRYLDGRAITGLVVGAPQLITRAGSYEL